MESIERKYERIMKYIKKNFDETDLSRATDYSPEEFGCYENNLEKFYKFHEDTLKEARESTIDMLLCLIRVKPLMCDAEDFCEWPCQGFYFNTSKQLVFFHPR